MSQSWVLQGMTKCGLCSALTAVGLRSPPPHVALQSVQDVHQVSRGVASSGTGNMIRVVDILDKEVLVRIQIVTDCTWDKGQGFSGIICGVTVGGGACRDGGPL